MVGDGFWGGFGIGLESLNWVEIKVLVGLGYGLVLGQCMRDKISAVAEI